MTEVRFSSVLQPLYAKQKGARGDREGLTPPDMPCWSQEELWVWWHWGCRGHRGCRCSLTLCWRWSPAPSCCPLTHPKTHLCPNPDSPSSPLHCHLLPGQTLYWREKPGALLTGDEFALISVEDLLAALPFSHHSVPTPGSRSADLEGTGDVKSAAGAGLHPRFPRSSSEPCRWEGKRHASNIWARSAGVARAEEFLLSSTL